MKLWLAVLTLAISACASTPQKTGSRDRRPAAFEARGPFSELIKHDSTSKEFCPDTVDGETCLMTHAQAEAYCRSQGAHLPTTREFATYSVGMGAKGILEAKAVKEGAIPEGYYKVDCLNPGKKRDVFYFNHSGYDRASGSLEGERLWTSSIVPSHPDFAHVFYGDWGGGGGEPKEHKRDFRNGVRCISGL